MGYCCVSCEVIIVCTRNDFFIFRRCLIQWFGLQVLYIILFLLAKNQTENLAEVSLSYLIASFFGVHDTLFMALYFYTVIASQVLVNAVVTQNWLYLTLLPLSVVGWAIKQLVNVIQVNELAP